MAAPPRAPKTISTTIALEDALSFLWRAVHDHDSLFQSVSLSDRIAAAEALGRLCLAIEENLWLREIGFDFPVNERD